MKMTDYCRSCRSTHHSPRNTNCMWDCRAYDQEGKHTWRKTEIQERDVYRPGMVLVYILASPCELGNLRTKGRLNYQIHGVRLCFPVKNIKLERHACMDIIYICVGVYMEQKLAPQSIHIWITVHGPCIDLSSRSPIHLPLFPPLSISPTRN